MSHRSHTPETPEASQPRPRVRRVILHVSQPSSDTPPRLPPLPPLPPESPPHTPSLPPLPPTPPPHLPPMAGPPNQISGQYSLVGPAATNAPPTYAHPYGTMSYPSIYSPVPHHALYGANIGAGPFPPWGYPQYPLVPLPGPFLGHPLATQHATTGDDDPLHGRVADGPVDQDILGREDPRMTWRDGGVGTNNAAPSSTVCVPPRGRQYPNKEVSDGVWQFETEVVADHIKHTFTAQTDMIWGEFREEVHHCLDRPRSGVHIMFRVHGDGCAWSDLGSERDWVGAIARLMGKVRSARTRAVSLEVKDKYESAYAKAQTIKGKGKGKEKRRREDDIPPAPSPDMAQQLGCLIQLQEHMICDEHSKPGKRTYCLVERSTEDTSGGHKELTHGEMLFHSRMVRRYIPC
ncbi:hypothetical protein EDB83DRAFT_2310613 [Lactarius deliciosus]|nr:hypothetical protein EDB83DRAFT_2310613 [Lactarius deliciosus]